MEGLSLIGSDIAACFVCPVFMIVITGFTRCSGYPSFIKDPTHHVLLHIVVCVVKLVHKTFN